MKLPAASKKGAERFMQKQPSARFVIVFVQIQYRIVEKIEDISIHIEQ